MFRGIKSSYRSSSTVSVLLRRSLMYSNRCGEIKRFKSIGFNKENFKESFTKDEKSLFDTLLQTVNRFKIKTTVRIAGGWVRDKLLDRDSHDIDVALDDMTGIEFAELINKYLQECGIETRKIGVIQANPEQSKHLQTAACTILGNDIDLVNLRSEEYDESSRIPVVKFGTALEDARRRDFTINALFYNVNLGVVEDFTGHGIEDLKNGIIRTPLPAITTFRDDPLRMLRAIRFATRYKFSLDDDIKKSLLDGENLELLNTKISRERIGTEFTSMVTGPNPVMALELLAKYNLSQVLFTPPSETIAEKDKVNWANLVDSTRDLYTALASNKLCKKEEKVDNYDPELVAISGMLMNQADRVVINNKKSESHCLVVVRDSLKLKIALATQVELVVSGCLRIKEIASEWRTIDSTNYLHSDFDQIRLQLGRLIYELKECYYLSALLSIIQNPQIAEDIENLYNISRDTWAINDLWRQKFLINGKSLMSLLDIKSNGPYVGILMNMQRDWIILNATQDLCEERLLEHLRAHKDRVVDEQVKLVQEKREEIRRRKAAEKEERAKRHEEHQKKLREERTLRQSMLLNDPT